jgi:imidazole glycerol phosphate synthase subunit HisF
MRQNRAVMSVWVYEQQWPMCRLPLTVGGGVSIEYTSSRRFERSKR